MARPKIYPARIELRLTEDQKQKLQKEARKLRLTANQFLRNLIDKAKA